MNEINAYIEMVDGSKFKPFYANVGDAGMDVYANEDVTIAPDETVTIATGFKIAVDEGVEVQIRPRSGLSAKTNLRVILGTIDCGYRGEYRVIVQNLSKDYKWVSDDKIERIKDVPENHFPIGVKGNPNGYYDIKKGDRIAQIVFTKVLHANLQDCEDVTTIGVDRRGGFGSSGVN